MSGRCIAPALLAALSLAVPALPVFAGPPAKKVLILGVDGLDPELLTRFMDEGVLPNFRRLTTEGDFKLPIFHPAE